MHAALLFAQTLLGLLPQIIAGVTAAIDAAEWGKAKLDDMIANGNRSPTDEEWAELNARTAALREALHTDDPPPGIDIP